MGDRDRVGPEAIALGDRDRDRVGPEAIALGDRDRDRVGPEAIALGDRDRVGLRAGVAERGCNGTTGGLLGF